MRKIATVSNLLLLLLVIWESAGQDRMPEGKGLVALLLIVIAPLSSLIALAKSQPERPQNKRLLSLYFERKRMEEQQRIERLRTGQGNDL